jgi:hypothetical protein
MTDLLIALLLAVIVAPFVPFFWAMFIPLAPATVQVRATLTTTPAKFLFSWDKQRFSVCEFPNKRLHRLMEFVQIPRKRCKVVIHAGQKEVTDVSIGTYWYQIVQTGKHTISFEPANPLTASSKVTVWPLGSMRFNMYDFVPSPGHRTFVGGRPLRNPVVQSISQDVEIGSVR